jgi:hypothetical protein
MPILDRSPGRSEARCVAKDVDHRRPFAILPPKQKEGTMATFVIEPHFRLQEWVAEEKGYFRAEGLDYEFRELIRSTDGQHHN